MTIINNVFVVDDDEAVRDSLRMMLKSAGSSVATFSSADEFLAFCNPRTEGCIILDINMPDIDGLNLQDELNRRGILMPIIFLTGQSTVRSSVRAFKAGAQDYLTKPVDGEELFACIAKAWEKCSQLRRDAHEHQSRTAKLAGLTGREREVMKLAVEGRSSKEIAELLGISTRTVENHRSQLLQKTDTSNILELARMVNPHYFG